MPLSLLFQGLTSWRTCSVVGAVILIAAVYGEAKYIGHLKSRLEGAERAASDSAAVAARAQQEYQRVDAIVSRAASEAERRRARYEIERRKISNVPPPQDGVLAPVLRRALDGLPEQAAGPSADGGRGSDAVGSHDLQRRSE
jgi:hypothetical protein